jgi:hypothetical protein
MSRPDSVRGAVTAAFRIMEVRALVLLALMIVLLAKTL